MTVLFYTAAIPAVVLLGLSKGGFAGVGMLATPLVALVARPVEAAAILLPILVVQDLIGVLAYRGVWDRWNLSVLLPGAVVGVLLGYLLAADVPEGLIQIIVGVTSVAFAARRLWVDRRAQVPSAKAPSTLLGVVCGAASGFTSMISHAGTPPFQIFVMPQRLPRDIFVGTSIVFFASVNAMKILPYLVLGQLSAKHLAISATLVPVAILSSWLGIFVVRRTDPKRFITIVYVLMVLIGVKLIFDGIYA